MRREFESFYRLHPELKQQNIIARMAEKMKAYYYKIVIDRAIPGTEKWHKLQQTISTMSSTTADCAIRSYFYEKSLKKCDSSIYVLPQTIICFPYNVSIGHTVFINRGVYITARGDVSIGNNTMIGAYTVINSGSHIFKDITVPIRDQGHTIAPIVIEDDVWIGTHVVITPGVVIGKGAVIGAGSIVTKSIPAYAVAAGCPATVRYYRNQSHDDMEQMEG